MEGSSGVLGNKLFVVFEQETVETKEDGRSVALGSKFLIVLNKKMNGQGMREDAELSTSVFLLYCNENLFQTR